MQQDVHDFGGEVRERHVQPKPVLLGHAVDVLRDKTEKRRRPVPSLHLRVILARTAVNRRRCLRTQAFNGLSRVITQEVYY